MATIEPYETTAGKRYRVRYRKPDHAQTTKRGFRPKRAAELFLASTEVAIARGEFVDATAARETIDALGQVWVQHQSHLKPSSLRPIEIAWRVHVEPRWGRTAVSAIRHSDVQAWVTQLGAVRGATTVLRAYGVLAAILDVAVRDKRLLSNPARGVNLPRKVKRAHTYLTHEQVAALAVEAGDKSTLVLVLAYTGAALG